MKLTIFSHIVSKFQKSKKNTHRDTQKHRNTHTNTFIHTHTHTQTQLHIYIPKHTYTSKLQFIIILISTHTHIKTYNSHISSHICVSIIDKE